MDTPQKPPNARSPLFIELAGTPAAGKTTMANRLQRFFESKQISAVIAEEPAARYPGPPDDKLTPQFNEWTLGESISAIADHRSNRTHEVVIFDRGAFDSLFWLTWFKYSQGMSESAYCAALRVARPLLRHTTILVIMTCSFEVARLRRPGGGRIMNSGVYPQILANYLRPARSSEIGSDSISHYRLETSELSIAGVESKIRAFIGAPQDGSREDVLASLTLHSLSAKTRSQERREA